MSVSMYDNSIPAMTRALRNLSGILNKGASYADGQGIDELVMTGYRLFPNMFPLTRQVQIASDVAKGAGARLAGMEPPSYPDEEVTFEQLQARIDKTVAFLESLKAEQIDGSETREIVLKAGDQEFRFNGLDFLHSFALPNLYFHITTAYNILRHVGVEVGKMDFLGGR
jgi:hypothetical protein